LDFTFLICSERSGSNLITRMLDAHSQVCGPATKHLMNPVVRNAFRYAPLDDAAHWSALIRDVNALLGADFSRWRTSWSVEALRALAPAGDLPGLLRGVFEAEAAAHGKRQLFIKENQLHEFVAFLLLHFPQSRFVTLVRDPRDMALSWKGNAGHPGGVCRAARQWQADQQQALKLHHDLQRLGRSVLLRYEDLVQDPQTALQPALAMMGLAWEPGMLDFHTSELTRDNASRQAAWSNLGKALMRDNGGKYRSALSAEEICAVECLCRGEMLHLGYACDHDEPTLTRFHTQSLADFERADTAAKVHTPPSNVQANIEAKRRFYERLPISA